MQITIPEAARRLGLSEVTVRAQVHNRRIAASKIGRDWLIDEAEVERYRSSILGRVGRPAGARDKAPRRRNLVEQDSPVADILGSPDEPNLLDQGPAFEDVTGPRRSGHSKWSEIKRSKSGNDTP